jgi:hypothetical protein
VVFSKLSKLLNQESALSAPCLQHLHLLWRGKGREVVFRLRRHEDESLLQPLKRQSISRSLGGLKARTSTGQT